MFRSGRSALARFNRAVIAGLLAISLLGCSGTDPQSDEQFPFPSLSKRPSLDPAKVSEAVTQVKERVQTQVPPQLSALLASDPPTAEEMEAFTKLADEVITGAISRIQMTPEEFASLTPEQVADLVEQAAKNSQHAIQVNLDELRNMTPEQRMLIAESAAVVSRGLVDSLANDARIALGHRRGSVRIGVNELGGYAASAAYLWVYLLELAGYSTVVEVASGASLADKLNQDQLDIAFEAVPDFLAPDTSPLGVWSDGRLNVQGRAGLTDTYPELANSLERFALNPDQMKSLAAVVKTRGVADPATQKAAVQLWLVNHPELIRRLAER